MKNNNTKKQPLGWQVYQTHDGNYCHLRFVIQKTGTRFGRDATAEIKFQSDNERRDRDGKMEFPDWYGFRLAIETDNREDALTLAKTVDRVCATLAERKGSDGSEAVWSLREFTPANFVWALQECRIGRAVHDNRTSEFTLVADLPDLALRKWGNRFDSVLAETESDARRKLTVLMAERWQSHLQEWLNAGAPCSLGQYSDGPAVETLDVICEPWFVKCARERESRCTVSA